MCDPRKQGCEFEYTQFIHIYACAHVEKEKIDIKSLDIKHVTSLTDNSTCKTRT